MARVKVKLLGNLRLYSKEEKKIQYIDLSEVQEQTIQEILDLLNIPYNEINLIFKNGHKVDINTKIEDDDTIMILPVVGGG